MKVPFVPVGMMGFFLKTVECVLCCEVAALAHSCSAINARRDVNHDVLEARGILHNSYEETTEVWLHCRNGS